MKQSAAKAVDRRRPRAQNSASAPAATPVATMPGVTEEAPRAIPLRDQKMLWGAASARCSFPKCSKRLVGERSKVDGEVLLGEMAHILPKSPDGPRGEFPISEDERNRYRNLILLCEEHHTTVDTQRATYSPEVLHRFKQEHERRCQEPFGGGEIAVGPVRPWVTETLFSTLLPVVELPKKVYSAECLVSDPKVLKDEYFEFKGHRPPPFTIRAGRLYAFEDLADDAGVFSRWLSPQTTNRLTAREMWDHPDHSRYYVTLLNVVLRKLAGARGLSLSKDDLHWYFPPGADGSAVSIKYQPLNKTESERLVAWQPTIRATGEKRSHWEHMAVGLQFQRITADAWVLAMRPERHFTLDGTKPLPARRNTRRATKRASRLYNGDVLEDANFWRSFLAEGKPRIIFRLGTQAMVIDARLLDASITWPGVPDDSIQYRNSTPEDDLFSRADLNEALGDDDDDLTDDDEDEALDE